MISSSRFTSCTAPLVTRTNVGMLPCRSSRVCILTAALRRRNRAQGNSARHRSMVVESRAYRLCSRSTPIGSRTYSWRAVAISRCAKSAKMRQTQIDGGGIQGIQALLQIDSHRLSDIQLACGGNQPLREVSKDAPVPRFIRVRQRGARHLATESQVIQLALQRTQTGFDVAQTLSIGQLGEGHRQILIPAGEAAQPEVALITRDATTELSVGKKADQLREDGAALIHEPLSALPEFKSRQARNGFNLLRSYYLQPALCTLTGQQWEATL